MQAGLRGLGSGFLDWLQETGRMGLFFGEAILAGIRPPYKGGRIIRQVHFIGVGSLFVILLTASFTGMVLGLQGYYTLRKFQAEGLLGSAVALSLIRELGPVLSALMVTGRAGSAMTAEIGIMRITEQIDALDAMAIDPIRHLVAPKMIAGLIAVPLLTSLFDLVGIYGGYLVGVQLLGVGSGSYFSGMEGSVVFDDIYGGIIKSVSFGLILTGVACYKGYFAKQGAEGVSRATTESVVLSSVLILIWDYFLTSIL
ncbi:ABC transporter permease [Nitrospiraceae bacterium HYJII51-Mn-bac16s-1-B09]|uniref:ABC transporter permease n=1 Tax=Candidatus Manganitrophus noduliformans TaxID=2606439 RepID=A0A7X6DN55_9BACT|nr:ABC transporter permease [Candidatus Manganitrophus noduliformans]